MVRVENCRVLDRLPPMAYIPFRHFHRRQFLARSLAAGVGRPAFLAPETPTPRAKRHRFQTAFAPPFLTRIWSAGPIPSLGRGINMADHFRGSFRAKVPRLGPQSARRSLYLSMAIALSIGGETGRTMVLLTEFLEPIRGGPDARPFAAGATTIIASDSGMPWQTEKRAAKTAPLRTNKPPLP